MTDRLDSLVLAQNSISCRGAARLASTMGKAGALPPPRPAATLPPPPSRQRASLPQRMQPLVLLLSRHSEGRTVPGACKAWSSSCSHPDLACCPALPPGMSCVLRHLDLSYNRVGDAGAAALSSALAGGAESPVPLQHLELAGNQVGG